MDFFTSVAQISQYGAWGHLEYQDHPLERAHEYRAIIDFARLGDFDLNGWYNAADIELLRVVRGLAPTGENAASPTSTMMARLRNRTSSPCSRSGCTRSSRILT